MNDSEKLYISVIPYFESDYQILSLFEVVQYNENILWKGIEFLTNLDNIKYALLKLSDINKHNSIVRQKAETSPNLLHDILLFMNLKKKTDENIFFFLEKNNFDYRVCLIGVRFINTIFSFISMMKNIEDIDKKNNIAKAISKSYKFESMPSTDLIYLSKLSGFNKYICSTTISYLKSKLHILYLLENTEFAFEIFEKVKYKFKMENLSDIQIMSFIKRSNYNYDVCEYAVSLLDSTDMIWDVLKRSDYDYDVFCASIKLLKIEKKSEFSIMELISNTNFDIDVCSIAIRFLKLKSNILYVLRKSNFHWQVCKNCSNIISSRLFSEEELIDLMIESNYNEDICFYILPYLTSQNDHIEIIIKTNFNNKIIKLFNSISNV